MKSKGFNKEGILRLCNEIDKKEQGSVYSLGSKSEILDIPRWSTGLADLDNIIGGGMPCGRTVEIFGAESAGKTTLAYQMCAQHEMCLDIPIEGTFDKSRAELFGNKKKQMLIYRARYGEKAFNRAIRFAEEGIPLIVIDSVPSMQPKEDVEKIRKAVNTDSESEMRIGGVARLMDKYLPTLEDVIEQTGTTVIFINQIRDKMNALPFGDNIQTPGGHKLKHSCSLRIQVARKGYIEIPNHNPFNTETKERIGMIMKVKVVKSKVSPPMQSCEIPLFYERGFVDFADLDSVRKEIMEEHKKKYKEMLE
nr:MAG TPA: Protein recA [Caudoviricetes sp.]